MNRSFELDRRAFLKGLGELRWRCRFSTPWAPR